MERLIRIVLGHRKTVLVLLLVVTAVFGYLIRYLEIDPAVESMILEDDPDKVVYEQFKEIFGHDEIAVVLYHVPDDIFTADTLKLLDRITRRLEKAKEFVEVRSITNTDTIQGTDWGMEVGPLIESVPEDPAELAEVRKKALSEETFTGNLVSVDGRTAAIVADIRPAGDDQAYRRMLVDRLHEAVDAEQGAPGQFEILGLPTAKVRMVDLIRMDVVTFVPLSVLSICLFLVLIFRSARGVVLPLLTVQFAMIWTLGILVVTGQKFTITTTTIIPLIQVYGVATVIHIFSHLSEGIGEHRDKRKALIHTCAYIGIPCFLTSLTTAIGFSSNSVSRILPIRVSGLVTAFGVMATYLIAFTMVPVILSYLPSRRQDKAYRQGAVHRILERALSGIVRINLNHPRKVVAVWMCVALLGIWGLFNLKVETESIKFFKKSDPLVVGMNFAEKHLGGINPMEVSFEGPPGSMKEPRLLEVMDRFARYAESFPEITKAMALSDFLKKMNQAMNEDRKQFYAIPGSRELVAQYLLLYSGDLSRFVDDTYKRGRVSIRMITMGSSRLLEVIGELNKWLEANVPEGYSARLTGSAVLYANMVNSLVVGQVKSLALAFFFILICMILILRSIKVGLLSMIPNMIPIFMNFGVMGLTGITLNISTAMISAIAIGIAVDNTTHYLWRVNMEYARDRDYVASMRRTIMSVGKPMSYTAMIIIAGFVIICAGNFVPNIQFGMLSAITMASAALADLFLTPCIILLFKPRLGKGFEGYRIPSRGDGGGEGSESERLESEGIGDQESAASLPEETPSQNRTAR